MSSGRPTAAHTCWMMPTGTVAQYEVKRCCAEQSAEVLVGQIAHAIHERAVAQLREIGPLVAEPVEHALVLGELGQRVGGQDPAERLPGCAPCACGLSSASCGS